MAIKIFISYANTDEKKLRSLCKALSKASFEPIVVADRRSPGLPLAQKVKDGILEATHFVPILTRESITNQWINQEIGFAEANDRIILPIVEQEIVQKLKGFVHAQNDLPFSFQCNEQDAHKEAANYRKCYKRLIDYLRNTFADVFTSSIDPKAVKQGQMYTTTVSFRGRVKNGFFDNRIIHLSSSFRTWNVDPSTFKKKGRQLSSTIPGELNGKVDRRNHVYSHSTSNWPINSPCSFRAV